MKSNGKGDLYGIHIPDIPHIYLMYPKWSEVQSNGSISFYFHVWNIILGNQISLYPPSHRSSLESVYMESTNGLVWLSGLILGLRKIQWETLLQSNAVFHWLGANLESALDFVSIEQGQSRRFKS